ncbi:MAG: ATP-binding protein [Anaerolineales bacterium]|nr:ATP-binding protein [Anaerolineales bacterium]
MPAFPPQGHVAATESLVDVLALTEQSLVLENGTFVRVLAVTGLDVERGDPEAKHRLWAQFAALLRRMRAPFNFQIVVTHQPPDGTAYQQTWATQAEAWQARAEASTTVMEQARRERMRTAALATQAFLQAMHTQTQSWRHSYQLVITHNPFGETLSQKQSQLILGTAVIQSAEAQLNEPVQLLNAALNEMGVALRSLTPSEMCGVVWEHYHHSAHAHSTSHALTAPAPAVWAASAHDGERLKDLLAPALIEEHAHYVRVGEAVARGYHLFDFDPRAPVDVAALLGLPLDITHAFYLAAADPVLLRQQFKEKETELRAASLVDVQRGALTDWSRQAAIQSLEQTRADMETALEAPYFLHWYALVWASDEKTLAQHCQAFETALRLRDIRYHPATRHHVSLLQTTRPLGQQAYKLKPRNMSAESLGPFFPFVRREYREPHGWHFGLHRGNGLLVQLNPFADGQHHASQLVIGSPGGGKSVYLKHTIETVLALGHRVFVIDPEREYLSLAVDFHAPYIELGRPKATRTLALDPHDAVAFQAQLVTLCEQVEALSGEPLTGSQVEAMATVYQAVMLEHGLLPDRPDTWSRSAPALTELIAALIAEPHTYELGRVLAYTEALGGGQTINLLDLNLGSETPIQDGVEVLWAFIQAITPPNSAPLPVGAFNALAEAYQAMLTAVPEGQSPSLAALHATLSRSDHALHQALADLLNPYAHGIYAPQFNQPTNVNLRSAPLVVFGLKSLREKLDERLVDVLAWQILRLVWNEIAASGAVQPIHVFVDEAWYWLKRPGAAARLEQMLRSFRKYNAALHLATQHLAEFARVPEAKAITDLVRVKMLFRQEAEGALQTLTHLFNLSNAEQADLRRVRSGEGWLLYDHDVRIPLYVAVNPRRLKRLATNRAQQQAVARASGRAQQPVA